MKKFFTFIIIICFFVSSIAQTITGKIVEQSGKSLPDLQLQLFIKPKVYTTISGTDGSFTFKYITDVKEAKLPSGYSISENYPNPFNPRTRININMPNNGSIKVEVFNILSEKVMDDINKLYNNGKNSIDLELNGLPNGIYFARITIDNKYTVIRKLMLMYGSQHLNLVSNALNFQLNASTISDNSILETKLDSLVVTGSYITKKVFTGLPLMVGSLMNLGNLIVTIPTYDTPCPNVPAVTYSGKTYKTVQIGTQCWMRENLDIGTMIQDYRNAANNNIVEKYCFYNNVANCNVYGGLYQWAEAVQYKDGASNSASPNPAFTGNIQGICPSDWHIPSKVEFEILRRFVGNNSNTLKAIGEGRDNGAGINTSGFSALLEGYRYYGRDFSNLGSMTSFWSSTESFSFGANSMDFSEFDTLITIMDYYKDYGLSVRCIKD